MAREDMEVRKKKIIEAAFKVFSEKGFKGATNKDIAEAAGITPGLIYWYFKDKEDLFNAVFEAKSPVIGVRGLLAGMKDAPPEIYFARLGEALLDFWMGKEFGRIFRLVFTNVIRFPAAGKMLAAKITETIHVPVVAFIEERIEKGEFKAVDPMVATQMFVGSLISFILLGRIFGSEKIKKYDRDQIVTNVVEVFLGGLRNPGKTEG